jgi:hypothetical protein
VSDLQPQSRHQNTMSAARRLRGQVGSAARSVTVWLILGYVAGSALHGFMWWTLVGGILMWPLGAFLSRVVFPYLDRRAAQKRLREVRSDVAVGVKLPRWESPTLDPLTKDS